MNPIYIDRRFAVLHPAAGTHGVVICNTLGDEALSTSPAARVPGRMFRPGGLSHAAR